MESIVEQHPPAQVLAGVNSALDSLVDVDLALLGGAELLRLVSTTLHLQARLHALLATLAGEADALETCWREHGTSTTSWLADTANLTPREATALIGAGRQLQKFRVVGAAAAAGEVLPGQAAAITSVLNDLPQALPTGTVAEAQHTMVGLAATHNSSELRRLSRHLLEVLAPDTADELEAERLEKQHRQAMRNRHLTFTPDHQGSIHFRGSLPLAEAEPFMRIIDARAAARRRGLERLDPSMAPPTLGMLRADALVSIIHEISRQAESPSHGGDRPRAVINLTYTDLQAAANGSAPVKGRLTGSGQPLPAGQLRQLLCDCDVMPMVLGGPSLILDVGRSQRLVTPAIRAALEQRDCGCVFPGCDKPPQASHAHHIQPWWAGGETALGNLVLLCPHHHGIVEPGHDPTADRWRVQLRDNGVAEVIPPRRVDPDQRPRVHARRLGPSPA